MATTTPVSDQSTSLGVNPAVDRLYDNVQAEVPAVGLELIKIMAWNTIEEFYSQSTLRRKHLYWRMAAGVQTIDFNPYDEWSLVEWVLNYTGMINGQIDPPAVLRDLSFPVPTIERGGEAWVALKPSSYDAVIACNSPYTELWSTWLMPVLAGTLARLYMQPQKPWSNPKLAMEQAALYRRGKQQARDMATRGYSAGHAIRSPYFARGRQ